MRNATNRKLAALLALALLLAGCPASAPRPAAQPTAREQALTKVMGAAGRGAEIAEAAGAARGERRIGQPAYEAVLAALAKLDGSWRRAAATLAAEPPVPVDAALAAVEADLAALEATWREHGPK